MENTTRQMVTFYLDKELFGIELTRVREIIRLPAMVRVPGTPRYFSGLANLRGSLLPVIDGRRRFNLPDGEETEATRVVVLEYRGETIGYIVDRMSDVLNLENATEHSLQAAAGREELISRVIRMNNAEGAMVMVINIEVLFPRLEETGAGHYVVEAAAGNGETDVHQEELKQFVGFRLADEEYAVAIETVKEIVWVPDKISRSPGFPPYMDGLFSLRRRTVPMLNLRRYFSLADVPYDDRARVLVLNLNSEEKTVFGLGVDAITEVLRFTAEEIEPLPELLRGPATRNLAGVCKLGAGERLVYLMDPRTILAEGEISLEGTDDDEEEAAAAERRAVNEEQFVVFHLQDEEYALTIQSVKEIIRPPEIVRVPRAPSYVEGVINIRGDILPVINLRRKLNLPAGEKDDRSRIVVVDMHGISTGLVVDAVREVRRISADQIDPVPAILRAHMETGYLAGVVKFTELGRTILLLSLQNILTAAEQMEVAQVVATGAAMENRE